MQDEKLVLDWPDWRGDASVGGQTITFGLAPLDGGRTLLSFVHAGYGRTTDVGDYGFGWVWFLEQRTKECAGWRARLGPPQGGVRLHIARGLVVYHIGGPLDPIFQDRK